MEATQVLAEAKQLLEQADYEAASLPEAWHGRLACVYEDEYGMVAVLVYDTYAALQDGWKRDQAEFVDFVSGHVSRSDDKASDGYLVLLTPEPLPDDAHHSAMQVRYNTQRVRKLVGTGDDIEAAPIGVASVLAPLLPLDMEGAAGAAGAAKSLNDELPALIADDHDAIEEEDITTIQQAHEELESLVEALHARLHPRENGS
jgi:hypothetical protein